MKQTKPLSCSLIITTYNRPDALELVIRSALQQSRAPDEIIIADDGSDTDTKSVVEELSGNASSPIIYSWQEDKGFRAASSRNKAIALAKSQYIVLIDGDMILHRNFIQDHMQSAEKNHFIQGSRVLLKEHKSRQTLARKKVTIGFFDKGLKNRINTVRNRALSTIFSSTSNTFKGIKTCNMSFFRDDCVRVNGFNEDFIGWGREDSEYVARLYNNDIHRISLKFSAIAFHLWHRENPRDFLSANDKLLDRTITGGLKSCKNGIDKYLNK